MVFNRLPKRFRKQVKYDISGIVTECLQLVDDINALVDSINAADFATAAELAALQAEVTALSAAFDAHVILFNALVLQVNSIDSTLSALVTTVTNLGITVTNLTNSFNAYVAAQLLRQQVQLKTGNYAPVAADDGQMILVNASGAVTIDITSALTAIAGAEITVKKINNDFVNFITITTQGAELIDGVASYVLYLPNQSVRLRSDGTNWYVLAENNTIINGSNANGSYTRFADGTQICYILNFDANGAVRTLPIAFANTNYAVNITSRSVSTNAVISGKATARTTTTVTTNATVMTAGSTGVTTPSTFVDLTAVGRWF